MSRLTITFLLALLLSYSILMLGTRTTASSKAVLVRLAIIQRSIPVSYTHLPLLPKQVRPLIEFC